MNILEKRRKELGMYRKTLARLSGVPLGIVNSILDYGIISEAPKNIRALAVALDFDINLDSVIFTKRPQVGIAVVIRRGDHVLLGLRKGGHSPDTWGFPGGHLEYGESFEECALREVEEETGIKLSCATYWTTENVIYHDEGNHYVTIFMIARMPRYQDAKVLEPKKCKQWDWFPQNYLPFPVMLGVGMIRKRLSIL